MSKGPVELPDGSWQLPLKGLPVNQIRFGYQVDILIGQAVIQIGAPFRLSGDHDDTIEPENAATLAPAIVMLRRVVSSATAAAAGSLVVKFVGGLDLAVPAGMKYEAWEAVGPHTPGETGVEQWRVVSMPGGELAIWT